MAAAPQQMAPVSGLELLAFAGRWSWATTASTLCAIFIVSRIVSFWNGLRIVSYWPGLRCPFGPISAVGAGLPTTWWNPGIRFNWQHRFDLYRNVPTDTMSIVPFLGGAPQFFSANLDVAHQVIVAGHKGDWIKPPSSVAFLAKWGPNLASVQKEVWARHRRILSPGFTGKTYQMVWEKTVASYHDMVAYESWSEKSVVDIPSVEVHTTKLAMLLVTSCGFGIHSTWSSPSTVKAADGTETMSIVEALRVDTQQALILDLFPSWITLIPIELMRKVKAARQVLAKYMAEEATLRREKVRRQIALDEESDRDVFTLLARANELEAQSNKLALSDKEMMGNLYFLLLAGHETTSHTFAAALALLAVNPEVQKELYQHIIEVVGPDGDPKYEDYHKLDKVLATFYEATRMFPAGHIMMREAANDTTLVIPGRNGEQETIMPVRKGTVLSIDQIGIQYNPRYFEDPNVFKPSRWLGNGQGEASVKSDLVSAFGYGPRTCIGRRFATTEAVAFLTMWLRDWTMEPLLLAGETVEQWKERVMDCHVLLTLGIKDVPVRLQRRNRFNSDKASQPGLIRLYDLSSTLSPPAWSPSVWRTRFVLNYKRLPYETEWVEFSNVAAVLSARSIAPTRIEPLHYTVPAIEDPAYPIRLADAPAIADYLENTYPERTIYPNGSRAAQLAGVAAVDTHFAWKAVYIIVPHTVHILPPHDAAAFVATRPALLGMPVEDMYLPEGRAGLWAGLEKGLDALSAHIDQSRRSRGSESAWLFGDEQGPGYADFVLGAALIWFHHVGPDEAWPWIERLHGGRWARHYENLKPYMQVV